MHCIIFILFSIGLKFNKPWAHFLAVPLIAVALYLSIVSLRNNWHYSNKFERKAFRKSVFDTFISVAWIGMYIAYMLP